MEIDFDYIHVSREGINSDVHVHCKYACTQILCVCMYICGAGQCVTS